MTKPFHAGKAAHGGVLAARLAAAGFTSSPDALEHPRGFLAATSPKGEADLSSPTRAGREWQILTLGLSVKKYPLCYCTHRAIDGALDLLREQKVGAGDVKGITVSTSRRNMLVLRNNRPQTGLEAKFSMEFCLAILLLERRAGLAEFTDEVVTRPDVRELIERVVFEADPAAEAGGFREMTTLIEVDTADGRTLRTQAEFGKGSPANPMTDDELVAKFVDCLAWGGIAAPVAHEVAARTLALDAAPSISHVLAPLAGATVRAA